MVTEQKEVVEVEKDEEEEIQNDKFSVLAIIHLIRCAVDVARQYKEIDNVNDLSIHPISTMKVTDERPKLLLKHVSEALHTVIKQLDVMLEINTRGGTVSDPEYPKSEAKM